MNCPTCGSAVTEGAQYCSSCGAQIVAVAGPPVAPAPGEGYGQPPEGYGQATEGYGQHGDNYAQPGENYAQPGEGYAQPGENYAQPGEGYAQPGENYAAAPPPPAPPAPPAYGQQYAPAPPAQPAYAQPAYAQPSYAPAPQVKNHLVMAILATLLCCVPLGAVGIIFAAQVNSKLAVGDYAGAQKASKNALLWSWIAIGGGLVGGVVYGLLAFAGALADVGSF